MVFLKFEEKITTSKEERLFEIVIVSIKKILPKIRNALLPFTFYKSRINCLFIFPRSIHPITSSTYFYLFNILRKSPACMFNVRFRFHNFHNLLRIIVHSCILSTVFNLCMPLLTDYLNASLKISNC